MTRSKPPPSGETRKIPNATVGRLITYLRLLDAQQDLGVATVSSATLSRLANVSAFQVRKDLAYFGSFGKRGAGYQVAPLRNELEGILGLSRPWNVAIVGMGRLGEALAHYPNLERYRFLLRALFDVDPDKIGQTVADLPVESMDRIDHEVRDHRIDLALLTVPADAAQAAADRVVAAGVAGILNFAPVIVTTPPQVQVEPVDFLAGLKRLSFHLQRPEGGAVADGEPRGT
ncbi:MAG: redox-sensing transcriptional repressor Rex [Trueperaceae bacterium]